MQPGAVQIAQPLNDTQLVALIAGLQAGTATERVSLAVDIVVESVFQAKTIGQRIKDRSPELVAEAQAKMDAANRGLLVPNGPIHPDLMKRNLQKQ